MKQVLQNVATGEAMVADVPAPKAGPTEVLVHNRASLVSAGTERGVVEFAEKSLLAKARSRPDLVKQVLEKASREGFLNTLDAVRNRLDQPLALGYSSAGIVIEVGRDVTGFAVGDRVSCAGGGFASHAEVVRVPRTLLAKIPDRASEVITFDEASFAAVGSVPLHALRLAEPQVGDIILVIGLGLLGLIAVQLVRAAGCRAIGFDLNADRCAFAERLGADYATDSAEELKTVILQQTQARGADAVLICAAAADSAPVHLAAEVVRDRGKVVAVGAFGMDLPRKLFYEKELDFKVSRSYGPGRYDAEYEQKGRDYPAGYVRWTEGRNLEAFLQLIADGNLDVQSLISHRFAVAQASAAYELISGKIGEPSLGVVLQYPETADLNRSIAQPIPEQTLRAQPGVLRVAVLGAGNFATATLLPAMKGLAGIELHTVAAGGGASVAHAAKKFGFKVASTDSRAVIADPQIDLVAIATRHDLHAMQVRETLSASKHVFCEKPLCLTDEELSSILAAYDSARLNGAPRMLMVGFNRRFARLAREMKRFFAPVREPLAMTYRVNAGFIPREHWTQSASEGGGRLIGECCHFIDLMTFLCGSRPVRVFAQQIPNSERYSNDNLALQVTFENGSLGMLTYVASGDKSFSKERVEVFAQGKVAVLDDFRSLELVSGGKRKTLRGGLRADKGHRAEWEALISALQQGALAPIPMSDIVATTLATFRALDSLRSGVPENVEMRPGEAV